MARHRIAALSGAILISALAIAACGGAPTSQPTANQPTANQPTAAVQPPATSQPVVGAAGKDITDFDVCSVVRDSELVTAITASASDPSALGTIAVTHGPVDGTITGLPGAKACKMTWTTTDAQGRQSQGGDPVIVTFDLYANLVELQGNAPEAVDDYASAGALAFDGPGDGGDPHITKDGYLFRMSGNSDLALLKAMALGIATRL